MYDQTGLNLRLQQLGFETIDDYARALTDGVVGNEQLVGTLAEFINDCVRDWFEAHGLTVGIFDRNRKRLEFRGESP